MRLGARAARPALEVEAAGAFLLGAVVLAATLHAAERGLECRAAEAARRLVAAGAAAMPRHPPDAAPAASALAAPPPALDPAAARPGAQPAPLRRFELSDPERHAYFSLVAALDIQGRPAEFAHLFMGTIRQESSFNPRATHPVSGARGLSQIMPPTGASYGLARADLLEPVPNLQAFVEYFYANAARFTGFRGTGASGAAARISRDQAVRYSLIAHNLGPSALEGLLRSGYCEADADSFVRRLRERIADGRPLSYRNRYLDRDETLSVAKMVEVVGFYDRILRYAGLYRELIARVDESL